MAGAGAVAILTFFWLPAEYGIDPTGGGVLLGLTDMGAIKQQLAGEAAAARRLRRIRPSAASGAIALFAVIRAQPYCANSTVSVGIRVPGFHAPDSHA